MLSHLSLKNFKIWQKATLRLAPVTLLLGVNSSGKSSLIQSLLLIRQTVRNEDIGLDLNLGNPDAGDTVTLGRFQDVLCNSSVKHAACSASQFSIEFRWSPDGSVDNSALFSARYIGQKSGAAELFALRLGRDHEFFTVFKHKKDIYKLRLNNERKLRGQGAEFRPQRSFAFSAAAINKLGEAGEKIKNIGPQLLEELEKIIYLGPVRRLAQRDYIWSGRMPSTIGDDGDKAIDALIASGLAFRDNRGRSSPDAPEAQLFLETAKWLQKMDLAHELAIKHLKGSTRYELMIIYNGEASNLKDVGVGVAQVLPVIVAALYAKPGHIVIVEEPESHLHPLAQALLAELFSQVSKERGVQFIAETHSEHLFRRLQTLIAREETAPDKCALYFVEKLDNKAELKELKANEFGAVENWPPKFFGDAIGEARTQVQARFDREVKKKG